jgi:hypothetical protein
MPWRMLLCALAVAMGITAGKAEACTYSVMNEEIGPKRTAEEIAADQERLRREALRQATRAAQRQLAGGADAASGLADMLVPNIHAVHIDKGGCGAGEIDWAGSDEAEYDSLVGTPYAGREKEFHPIVSDYGPGTLGPLCNAEFRGRFAEHLRRRLTPAQLKASFVFLAARRRHDVVERLMAFEGNGRRPPVRWAVGPQIFAWAGRHPAGRALSAAIADFWRDSRPLLGRPELSCPTAAARWRQDQAELVARIEDSLK